MGRTSVVIADPHPVILEGLSKVLGAQRDFRIVARCRDGASCIEAIRRFAPDIAVLDVAMPDIAGLEVLAIVNSENLITRVVFFTASVAHRDLIRSASTGACSVILKDVDPTILVQTLRQVANGKKVLPAALSDWVEIVTDKSLTDRERQIMHLVSAGLSNKEIGRRLRIADGTIKVHLHHIYQKLDINNRTALAALAMSQK